MIAGSNCLSDDVLSGIFQILDVPDLLSCIKVCWKWKSVIESLVFGRRFFQRLKKSSAAWRRAWRKLERDESNLKAEDYKKICRFCLQYLEKVDDNLRAGRYKLKTGPHTYFDIEDLVAVGEDYITAYYYKYDQVLIFDRESIELKQHFRPDLQWRIIDVNIVVYLESQELTFHDTNTGQLIKRFNLHESPFLRFDAYCPRAKLWTVIARLEFVLRLTLWTVDNASNVILIKIIEVPRSDSRVFEVDEQFILHQQRQIVDNRIREKFHFVSTGIVHDTVLERSLSIISRWKFHYDRGLLFFTRDRDGLIRILDVTSGTYLHDIDMGESTSIEAIKVNLNYVVIFTFFNVYVYSLQALRNPLPSDAFVSEIKYRYQELFNVSVDETQIVCLDLIRHAFEKCTSQITVFDFGSFYRTPTSTLAAPGS